MLTPRSGLSRGSVSLLGYLEEHPEASKELYTTISKRRKAQSNQLHMSNTVVCYQQYFEDCKRILHWYRNRISTDMSQVDEFREQAE